VEIAGGGDLEEPLGIAKDGLGEEVGIGERDDGEAERGGRAGDAVEGGGVLVAKAGEKAAGLLGVGYGGEQDFDAGGDALGERRRAWTGVSRCQANAASQTIIKRSAAGVQLLTLVS
jgi:hypothetical protein